MMLLLFIRDRLPWISFMLIILCISNILFYFDAGLSTVSIHYYNIVVTLLMMTFLFGRYVRESKQLKLLLENTTIDSLFSIDMNALSPFQRKYVEKVQLVLAEKEYDLNLMKIKLQEDSEDLLAWVHEMKTPITAMRLMIEQIEDSSLRNKVEKEWLRLHLLLDQQLHSTRIGHIEKDNRMEKVDLKRVIFSEIKEYQAWCLEKGIGFDIQNIDIEVITDKKWLGFIIRQILSNAIKYSFEQSEITIYTEQDDKGHTFLHFKDTGIGIKAEDLPRIFEKSYTGTIGRNKSHSTGMGLYLAKNAATKLGIQLLCVSEEGKGSTFTIQFPIENEYEKTFSR